MADILLTVDSSTETLGGVVFIKDPQPINSGTGTYIPFLATSADKNDGVAEGFNGDGTLTTETDQSKTASLLLSSLELDATGQYYVFRLDLNENDGQGELVTLNEFKLYQSSAQAGISDYFSGTDSLGAGFSLVYDLDATASGGDKTLILIDDEPGSGKDNYKVLIPINLFSGAGGDYITLVTEMGRVTGSRNTTDTTYAEDGGFDEWRALTKPVVVEPAPTITLEKTVDAEDNGSYSETEYVPEGVAATADYKYVLTNTSAATDPLTVTSLIDDRGTVDTLDDIDVLAAGSLQAGSDANGNNKLDVGETWTYVVSDVVIPSSNASSSVVNEATVKAIDNENVETTDSDTATVTRTDVAPVIDVAKTGPASIDEGGADVTWTFTITNNSVSTDPVTITALDDDKLGSLLAVAEDQNGGPITLASGAFFSFDYNPQGDLVLDVGEAHTNTVTVAGVDDEGNEADASDDHTIVVTDVLAAINIVKSGPATINEGGASVIYTYDITNVSAASTDDELTVTSILDDGGPDADDFIPTAVMNGHFNIGDADEDGKLDKGETWKYTATATVTIDADESYQNTVTVKGNDGDGGADVSAADDHVVKAINVAPTVEITKRVDANGDGSYSASEELDEGVAKIVSYRVTIKNTSVSTDPITLSSLLDDKIADDAGLLAAAIAANGGNQVLGPDATITFEYLSDAAIVLNASGSGHVNGIKVMGQDNEDTAVEDSANATVTGKNLDPSINVEKTVSPSLIQAGNASVVYTYAVTNTSAAGAVDPLSNIILQDDNGTALSGDDFSPTYQSGDDSDGILEVGETWLYTAMRNISLAPGASQTNIVTATGTDDEGMIATDVDDATVTALTGPGARTPGFWSNNGLQFWDGKVGGEKQGPSFPGGEMLAGLNDLIVGGDHDNVLEAGEIGVSRADALAFLNASQKQQGDGRWMLLRDMVATELNFRAGNPGTDADPATYDPQDMLNDAVMWIDKYVSGINLGNDGASLLDNVLTKVMLATGAVKTSGLDWSNDLTSDDRDNAASTMHTQLDGYNNNGMLFGNLFANDGDFVV